MSCVNWWNECTNKECGNVGYDRHKELFCEKCGAPNHSIVEYDEEFERPKRRPIFPCRDEWGDDIGDYE